MRDTAIGGFAFASAVQASAIYSATAANGVQIGAVPIRNGATTLGTLSLHLARDANNILGYYLAYTGASGSHNFALDLSDLAAGFIPNDKPRSIQGGRIATWTSPGGAAVYNPTNSNRLSGWAANRTPPGENQVNASSPYYLVMNNYIPTANCFGYLLVAKVNGSEVARAILNLGPSAVSDLSDDASNNSDDQYGILILGRADPNTEGQFLRIRYRALRNGTERLALLAYPNRFTGTDGGADRWSQLPANLTVDLYEAVNG